MIGNQRSKFYCQPCDIVSKARHGAKCPGCGANMKDMGTKWRPGKRGSHTRMWDERQAGWRRPSIKPGRKHRRHSKESVPVVPQFSALQPWFRGTIWEAVFPNIREFANEQELMEKIARG